jgi:hypothetical protein
MTTSPTPVLDTPDASTVDTADASPVDATSATTVDAADPAIDLPAETPPEPALPALRILKIANCGSLSGRSTLTYHVGILEASNASSIANSEIQLRLFHNTAKGYFCKDWVSMALIDLLLTEAKSFSSGDVQRLFFQGKSVNSGGFVLAALRHEGLIRTSEGSLRSYERLDPSAWQGEIAALIEAGVSLSEHQAPEVPVVAKKGKASKASVSKGPEPTKKKPA